MKRYFWILTALILAVSLSACGEESFAGTAATENTYVEFSSTGDGGEGATAASAGTPNTVAELSSVGSEGGSASSSYAATPDTSAESSSVSTGGAGGGSSSSSSYSSTTTTTTTTTTSASSSSSSSGTVSEPGYGLDPFGPWLPWPPSKPSGSGRRSSGSSAPVETIVRSEEVTGRGWTLISRVNVRTMPSVRAKQVVQIRSAGTEVMVDAKVLNSSGEAWYAVKLYQGYVGYIRSDLLRVEVTEAHPKDETDEVIVKTVKKKTNGTPKVIYIIVDPEKEEEEEEETRIIYITPDQAEELGIMEGETPLNG